MEPKPLNTLWILEDEQPVRFTYEEILKARYNLRFFGSLGEFREHLELTSVERPRLLIADLRLPDGNFMDFLSESENSSRISFPFLVISSCADEETLHECFEEGAIDYLIKPFTRSELQVKLSRYAMSNWSTPYQTGQMQQAGTLAVNADFLTATNTEGMAVELTPKELQFLKVVQSGPTLTASRSEITGRLWKDRVVTPKNFDMHLFNLRRKLRLIGWEISYESPEFYRLTRLSH